MPAATMYSAERCILTKIWLHMSIKTHLISTSVLTIALLIAGCTKDDPYLSFVSVFSIDEAKTFGNLTATYERLQSGATPAGDSRIPAGRTISPADGEPVHSKAYM